MLSKIQIKDLQSLQLKKNRDQKKQFILEGIKNVAELISFRPSLIRSVYGTEEFFRRYPEIRSQKNFQVELISEDELKKISFQATPNGVLAVCRYLDKVSEPAQAQDAFSFFLDDIRDPGNFGTILRLCAWYGHSKIFCSPSSCDLYNPKVIQSTMGAFMHVGVEYIQLKDLLTRAKFKDVYGAVLDGEDLYESELKPGLIVIGNEANGIAEENMPLITRRLTIPKGETSATESLNAAMAASIIASEFFRRNRAR